MDDRLERIAIEVEHLPAEEADAEYTKQVMEILNSFPPPGGKKMTPVITAKASRAAFYSQIETVDGLRYYVKIAFESRPSFTDAGPALLQIIEFSGASFVDVVLFLKDVTPAESAIINGEKPKEANT